MVSVDVVSDILETDFSSEVKKLVAYVKSLKSRLGLPLNILSRWSKVGVKSKDKV